MPRYDGDAVCHVIRYEERARGQMTSRSWRRLCRATRIPAERLTRYVNVMWYAARAAWYRRGASAFRFGMMVEEEAQHVIARHGERTAAITQRMLR